MKTLIAFLVIVVLLTLTSCGTEEVEVTREVEVLREVQVAHDVEVTRLVKETVVEQVEVTRIVKETVLQKETVVQKETVIQKETVVQKETVFEPVEVTRVVKQVVTATPVPPTPEASHADKVRLTVATVSMTAVTDKEANLQEFFTYMVEAAEKGAHLIVFPEVALQQCPAWGDADYRPTEEQLDYVSSSAETIPGESTERVVEKAKELNIYVIFGMTEKVADEDALYNTSVFVGPDGIIGKYRKMNLWWYGMGGNEDQIWKSGNEYGVFDSPIGRVGLMICIDMYHDLGSELADDGADLLVSIAGWPGFEGPEYETSTVQNATKTGRWHLVSNLVGWAGSVQDYGHSRVVDPKGNIVADTGAKQGMVIAETDLLIEVQPER